ncbi:hypothetical protein [Pedobacter sp. Leaf170]|uniref:hypothetical protein n=1 Tax=Pedobacter sp. Leaf170 TaxID=2876558 RepID=UPI001E42346D|nr:hypothetical protein [Pedobacter sp. Leaf170]
MKGFLLIFFACCSLKSVAQSNKKHQLSDELHSLNWDIIGSVKFELTDKNELFPIFSESIKRFENKVFDLTGYLIPIKAGVNQQKFFLATLPINQCYFCGKNGIPAMIMVEMDKAIAFSVKPIKIAGILKLERRDASFAAPISLKNAKIII